MSKSTPHLITWQAPEFRHYHKNLGWYITFWAVVILLIGYLLISKDYFGAISISIIAGIATYLLKQKPEVITVSLGEHGIHIDDLYIPYQNMQHFWIVDTEHHRTLNIETTAYLNRFIILELEDQDPKIIRDILSHTVPEHNSIEPTLAQKLMHRLNL